MRTLSGFLALALISASSFAQQQAPSSPPHDGGRTEVLQSIYIPPIHDAPFTATVHTEWVKPMAGGGTTTVVNQRKIVRDRDGRIYQERWLLIPKGSKYQSQMNLFQVYDPNQHTGYDCFTIGPQKDHCELQTFAGLVREDVPVKTGPLPNNAGLRTHEDLGRRMVEGQETVGARDTIIVNPGVMGNDQTMTITREYWHSAKLGVNLLSTFSDPRVGTQTFTLSDVEVTEPDPKYFVIPDSYQIMDLRQKEDPQKAAPSPN